MSAAVINLAAERARRAPPPPAPRPLSPMLFPALFCIWVGGLWLAAGQELLRAARQP